MRPSRPRVHALRHTPQRKRSAQHLQRIRKKDRETYAIDPETPLIYMHYQTRRGMVAYNEFFRTQFSKIVRELLSQKNHISVLDIGAGEGVFGQDIINEVKDRSRVSVFGLSLAMPPYERIKGFTKYHVGNMEKKLHTWFRTRQFDLITCFDAAPSAKLVIQIAQKITPQGYAFVRVSMDKKEEYDTLTERLKRIGFEVSLIDHEPKNYAQSYHLFTIRIRRKNMT